MTSFFKRNEYKLADFAWMQWNADDIARVADAVLTDKVANYDAIKAIPADVRTFVNTVYAIETSGNLLVEAYHRFELLMQTRPEAEVRDAAQKAINLFNERLVDIEYDLDLYRAVKEFTARGIVLTGADDKLYQDTVLAYRRMGFDLPEEKRQELKNNLKKLADLGTQFDRNINEWSDHILVTREQLDGLPDTYIAGLEREGDQYKISLKYPEYFPFVDHARDEKARMELLVKFFNKGGQKNLKILSELIELRQKNAQLLGYATHADYQTETRMAKNAATVEHFISDLREKVKPLVDKDIADLKDAKKRAGFSSEFTQADVRYWLERLQEERFSVDANKVREYFPLHHVMDGMFKIYQTILGVRFTELRGYPLQHPDARLFRVDDKNDGLLGYFGLDLYPRPNKYGHAAVFPVTSGQRKGLSGDEYVTPFVMMVCNFPKASNEAPSLLSHDEVKTFFHEFGHVMHGVLTVAPYSSQSGTSVSRDFVEAPSQMLENWVWDAEMLKILSAHYKTNEPLPQELLDNMIKAKSHGIGHFTMRQLMLGTFDMGLHNRTAEKSLTPQKIADLYNKLVAQLIGVSMPAGTIFPAGFGHLNGYDAGYYGYMWSKVYSSDMFTRFKEKGLLDISVGTDYRQHILEPGSSREEMDLLVAFLGRQPSNEAFLKEIGL